MQLGQRGIPVYVQLKEEICSQIRTGALLPGETMLPVRELASRLAINPRVIVRVYEELVSEGILCRLEDGTLLIAEGHECEKLRRVYLMRCLDDLVSELKDLSVTREELYRHIDHYLMEEKLGEKQ